MSCIYEALKKAEAEGKLVAGLGALPENRVQSAGGPGPAVALKAAPGEWKFSEQLAPLAPLPPEVANDFRLVVENLRLLIQAWGWRTIGMLSCFHDERSATVAVYTAAMLAETLEGSLPPNGENGGHRLEKGLKPVSIPVDRLSVVLVDADFAAHGVDDYFATHDGEGLAEVLLQRAQPGSAIKSVLGSPLKVLTAGPASAGAGRDRSLITPPLLTGVAMQEFINQLKLYFEVIILHLPPLLEHPEALGLAKFCDGVALVVEAGATRLEDIEEAGKHLQQLGSKFVGIVLNKRKIYIPETIYRRI